MGLMERDLLDPRGRSYKILFHHGGEKPDSKFGSSSQGTIHEKNLLTVTTTSEALNQEYTCTVELSSNLLLFELSLLFGSTKNRDYHVTV